MTVNALRTAARAEFNRLWAEIPRMQIVLGVDRKGAELLFMVGKKHSRWEEIEK